VPEMQITVANQIATSAGIAALTIEEAITTMQLAGMSKEAIKLTLLNDLKEGGVLFGAFRNKIKNTVKNTIELSSRISVNATFVQAGVQEYRWVAVGGGKTCPDCEERNGEIGTMEFFETIGLPQSGFSVCTDNCRCILIASGYKGENLDKPLVKQKN